MSLQPGAAADSSSPSHPLLNFALPLSQACAAAVLRDSTKRAAEASRAAALAKEAAEEAERSLAPRVRALLGVSSSPDSSSSSFSSSLRVDLGSGVLARAVPVKDKTAILPVGLGFYLESQGSEGDESRGEALALASARVAALWDRAQRAATRASSARAEAARDARAALAR